MLWPIFVLRGVNLTRYGHICLCIVKMNSFNNNPCVWQFYVFFILFYFVLGYCFSHKFATLTNKMLLVWKWLLWEWFFEHLYTLDNEHFLPVKFCHFPFVPTVLLSLPSHMHISSLPHRYSAAQLHFHWGSSSLLTGSEHMVNGIRFAGEVK